MTYEQKYNELTKLINDLNKITKNVELSAENEAKLINQGSKMTLHIISEKITQMSKY